MSSTTAPALPDSPAGLLRAVRDQKKAADKADVEMMRLAVHWADLHIADPEFAEACFTSPKTFAGEGSPSIDEFCVPEFATMLGRTCDSAGRFLTDCVEVAYRHDDPEQGGPTATDNLAPLCRRHHRLKTRGRWRYEMTEPGVFVWTSPLGNTYLRDHTGSQPTGRAWPEPRVPSPRDGTGTPDRHDAPPRNPASDPDDPPKPHPPDH